MNAERNYGVDLLRLVLMFMVCVLHTLGQGGIIAASTDGTLNSDIYLLLDIIACCAVDGFALISGYMAKDKPRKYEKLTEMWFQAFFYSFVVTLILTVVGINQSWGIVEIIKCALPVTSSKTWYFTAYFVLFLAAPFLNKFLFAMEDAASKKMLIILVVLFSGLGIVSDPFKTQNGYSVIWLVVLYCIGVLAQRIKLFEKKKNLTLVIMWAGCVAAAWIVRIVTGKGILTYYISPTVLLSGLIMVILFSRFKLKGKIISKLSPFAFGVYLFQSNQVIWNNILKDRFTFVAEKNILLGVLLVFAFASLIFVSGITVDFIRSRIAKLIRIPSLCKLIVGLADKCLAKLFVLLK